MTTASEGRAARANNEFTFKDMSFTVQKGAGILDKMRGMQPGTSDAAHCKHTASTWPLY